MFVLRVKEREKLCAVTADSVSVAGTDEGWGADMPVMKVRCITEIKQRSKVRI